MIRSGTIRKATTQGMESSNVSSMARFCAWLRAGFIAGGNLRAMSGSSTVPIAMPITPIGN